MSFTAVGAKITAPQSFDAHHHPTIPPPRSLFASSPAPFTNLRSKQPLLLYETVESAVGWSESAHCWRKLGADLTSPATWSYAQRHLSRPLAWNVKMLFWCHHQWSVQFFFFFRYSTLGCGHSRQAQLCFALITKMVNMADILPAKHRQMSVVIFF